MGEAGEGEQEAGVTWGNGVELFSIVGKEMDADTMVAFIGQNCISKNARSEEKEISYLKCTHFKLCTEKETVAVVLLL